MGFEAVMSLRVGIPQPSRRGGETVTTTESRLQLPWPAIQVSIIEARCFALSAFIASEASIFRRISGLVSSFGMAYCLGHTTAGLKGGHMRLVASNAWWRRPQSPSICSIQIQEPLPRPGDVFGPCLTCRVAPGTMTGAHDVHRGCRRPPSTDTAPTPPADGMKSRGRQASNVPAATRIDRLRHPRGCLRWMQRCSEAVGCRGRAFGWRPIMPPRAASGWWNASGAGLVRATTRPPSPNTPLLMPASTAPRTALIPLHAPSGGAAVVAIVAIPAITASILPRLAEPPPGAYLVHAL